MTPIEKLCNDTYDFNLYAGNLKDVTLDSLKDQLKVLQEEVRETGEALDENNAVEVLDGCIDVLVVVMGMLHKLDRKGINTSLAMKLVGENNLTKVLQDYTIAEQTVSESKVPLYIYPSPLKDVFVVKRQGDNKIMKPKGFKSVDLSGCIPVGLAKL
jgi:hypothetical protein